MGKLKKNKRVGFGYRKYSNQKIYIGFFDNDLKDLYGKLLSAEGKILYEGQYQMDKMHGKGLIYLENEFFYEGEFQDNKMQGSFVLNKSFNNFRAWENNLP